MALTTDLLNASAVLSGLTEEQKKAIVEMSNNDEATVIGQRVSKIYGDLDADILSTSGMEKNGAEKTYDYAKRVIGEIKENVNKANAQVADLTKEKARLEKVISEGGGDAETKKALSKATADLANVTKEYTDLKTKYDAQESEHKKALFDLQLDGEIRKATADLKFKADLPKAVTDVILSQVIAKVKGYNPEYIDDGQGGKVLAFNENGTTMRNPNNNLRPYTAGELLAKEMKAMGVLDEGRTQTGAGSHGGAPTTTPTTTGGNVDIAGARTQDEASEIIAKALMAQGMVVGSEQYAKAMDEAWKVNKDAIKALPIR